MVGLLVLLAGCEQASNELASVQTKRLTQETLIDGVLSSQASMAVTLNRKSDVIVWNTESSQPIYHWSSDDFSVPIFKLALSGNQQQLAVAGKQQLILFNLKDGTRVLQWQAKSFNPDASISSLYLNHDAGYMLVGMSDGAILTINRQSNQLSQFKQHDANVSHVELYSADEQVFSTSHDGSALIWSTNTGDIIKRYEFPQRMNSAALDTKAQRIFLADALDNHKTLDLITHASFPTLEFWGRYRYFRKALFIRQGTELITATSKNKVFQWDVATGKQLSQWQLKAYTAGTTVLSMVETTADTHHPQTNSRTLTTLSSDGAIEVWPID